MCAGLLGAYQPELMAQTVKASIVVNSVSPPKVQIELQFPSETDALSFRNSYGSVVGLAQRIAKVEAFNGQGEQVQVKGTLGEFASVAKTPRFRYEVDLSQPSRLEDMSHVSWLHNERGLLRVYDLLPRLSPGLDVELHINPPSGWAISSNFGIGGDRSFLADQLDKAVFLIGVDLREESKKLGPSNFRLTTSGQWPFSNSEVVKIAQKILNDYAALTGYELKSGAHLMLIPFPDGAGPERWTAEARGNTVVLLLGREGNSKQLIRRLGILLSHELFHVWVPNSLKLDGDYDWFFEGFTLYQALMADMRLGLISFDEYLDTMGRVYRSYLATPASDKLSLIEASERRWTTSASVVYDKGMLVAFIYDMAVRSKSNCRDSVSDVYQELFRVGVTGHGNANETIIPILNGLTSNSDIAKDLVEGHRPLSLEAFIAPFGLDVMITDANVRLNVRKNLSNEQRRLLKCIGFRG